MKLSSENHFIQAFENKLKTVKNTNYLIQNEINQIKTFTSSEGNFKEFIGDLNYDNETNSVFDLMHLGNRVLFNDVFHQYLINGEYESILGLPDEEDESPLLDIKEDDYLMSEIEEAVLFANYYEWLNSIESKPVKKTKEKKDLSLKQRILVLHYLGLDLNQTYKTTLSEVLSLVLGLDESNTKKGISELLSAKKEKDIKTNENLLKMLEVFDNKSFTEIKLKINKDLEKFGVSD